MAADIPPLFQELVLDDATSFTGRGTVRGPCGTRGRRPQGTQGPPLFPWGTRVSSNHPGSRGLGYQHGTGGLSHPQGTRSVNHQGTVGSTNHQGSRGSGHPQGTRSVNHQGTVGSTNHQGSRGSGHPQGTRSVNHQGTVGSTNHQGSRGSGHPQGTRGACYPHKTIGSGNSHGTRGTCHSREIHGSYSKDLHECTYPLGTQGPIGNRGKTRQSHSRGSQVKICFSVAPQGSYTHGNPHGNDVRPQQPRGQRGDGGHRQGSRGQGSGELPREPQRHGGSMIQQNHQTQHGGKSGERVYKKLLFLLRGPPGSGKSTLARELLSEGPNGVVLSTDQFFCRNGRYEYNASQLEAAHTWNHQQAEKAMKLGKSPVIIDNTNLNFWEMKPYVLAALEHTYKVIFKEPKTQWLLNANQLARRNTHGVTVEKIKRMLLRFERPASIDKVLNS
ncbi:uncharacterized protein LOC116949687 [Petromyzon marinus]|uniref:uncharacterized protein LOC116949687 n=1 Tax=Petromyzon marinus TaxID=7757 RepID=UPI003F70C89B